MPVFTVQQGKRYRATITLGFFQSRFSNETVAGKFQEVGFTEVEVLGSGRNRLGRGLWPRADASAEVPPEITSVTEIEV
jgi:hypothetical protein